MLKVVAQMSMVLGVAVALVATPALAQQGNAKVRVVHASPDAPAVDVYLDGAKVLSDVPFFTASDYLDVPAGPHDIKVTPAGDANTAVIDAKGVAVEAGKSYTVAATGKLADIKATILADNQTAPAAGKAKVRVVHASPDTPAVDVKLKGGATLVPGLAFPKESGYLEVDAGSYDFQVVPTGATSGGLDLAGTRLEAGKIYDLFAVGLSADGSLKVQPVVTTVAAAVTPSAPAMMPATSGEELPLALFAGAAALLLLGGFALRRQAR